MTLPINSNITRKFLTPTLHNLDQSGDPSWPLPSTRSVNKGRRWSGSMTHVYSYIDGWVPVFTWRTNGTRVHYGKKVCEALRIVLLEHLGSCSTMYTCSWESNPMKVLFQQHIIPFLQSSSGPGMVWEGQQGHSGVGLTQIFPDLKQIESFGEVVDKEVWCTVHILALGTKHTFVELMTPMPWS